MIKPETVERVRQEADIVEVIGSYLPLKKVGRNFKGLCPFHPDRSPSFYVNPERQTYHCFGCGTGGNVLGFIMAQEKLAFPDAVRFLANRLGIEVLEQTSTRNRPLYEACEQAAQFFESELEKSRAAQAYLARRGLSSGTAKKFRLGYAPSGNRLRAEARKRSWPEEDLIRAGLLARREDGPGDYFFDRLMCPILSMSGKVVGFGGRVLDDREPKYLNSPETDIFRKGYNLYGGYQARSAMREQMPILVEGNFDVMSLVDSGFANTVAPLGTALTPNQALLLAKFSNRVVVCFDGDAAGAKASRRAIEVLLSCGVEPQVAALPAGTDPDSFVRKHGEKGLRQVLDNAKSFVDYVVAVSDTGSVLARRQVLREVAGLLARVNDDTTRELYANEIAARFGVNKTLLMRDATAGDAAPAGVTRPTKLDEKLVSAAMQKAELAQVLRDFCAADTLADARLKALAGLVAEHCEENDFGPALLLNRTEDEELRRLIARLTFVEQVLPTVAEFEARVKRLRACWLHDRIVAAHAAGKEREAERLSKEKNELLRAARKEQEEQ